MNTIFLHIKSVNLGLYFNSALISPANYIKTRSEDIQSKFRDKILLSDKKWSKSTDCSLELVVTENEYREISKNKINENYFLYIKPLPISRVKHVYFQTIEQSKISLSSTNTNAFLPKNLVSIIDKKDIETAVECIDNNFENKLQSDFNPNIKKYDRILGGAAFMRLGGAKYMNYSKNYFSTFAFFNQLFGNEYEKASNSKIDRRYQGVFECKDNWEKFCPILFFEKSIPNEIQQIANKKGLHISDKKENGIYDIEKISDDYIYILAILENFGHRGKRKNTDGLVNLLSHEKIKKAEGITLLYGLYNGYAGFRNKYVFQDGEIIKTVKFRLDNQVDYYTIESIYQYVFNKISNNKFFQYLDNWIPKKKQSEIKGFETYQVLDQQIIYAKSKPKFGEPDYFENLMQNSSLNKIIVNTLTSKIKKWFEKFPFNVSEQELEKDISNTLTPITKQSLTELYYSIVRDTEQNDNKDVEHLEQEYILEQQNLEKTIKKLKEENNSLKKKIENKSNGKQTLSLNFPQISQKNYNKNTLLKLTVKELKNIAEEQRINYKKKCNKNDLINLILKSSK